MMTALKALLGWKGIAVVSAIFLASAAGAFGLGYWRGYSAGYAAGSNAVQKDFDAYRIAAQQAVIAAEARARKDQQAIDAVAREEAVKAAVAKQKIVVRTVTITKEIPAHVPDDTALCIPLGLVRVIDAAALGRQSATDLPLGAGLSDESCAPLGARALAETIVRNYGAASDAIAEAEAWRSWYAREQPIYDGGVK